MEAGSIPEVLIKETEGRRLQTKVSRQQIGESRKERAESRQQKVEGDRREDTTGAENNLLCPRLVRFSSDAGVKGGWEGAGCIRLYCKEVQGTVACVT
jgi:hypothetical protein